MNKYNVKNKSQSDKNFNIITCTLLDFELDDEKIYEIIEKKRIEYYDEWFEYIEEDNFF